MEPRVALTHKGTAFFWSCKCEEALNKVRMELVKATALRYPDYSNEFHLTTDASDYAMGATG